MMTESHGRAGQGLRRHKRGRSGITVVDVDQRSTVDEAMQKTLGMAAAGWRQTNVRDLCARSLSWDARSRANLHTAAAADAHDAMLDPLRLARNVAPDAVQDVMSDHQHMAKRYLDIAHAHRAVAERARAEAANYAKMLINQLTPWLVRQRLSALEPGMAAAITRLFGDNLADARTRARVFEACDFAQWEGGIDEIALTKHEGISTTRECV
jgi:hypothetical protein